MAYYKNKKANMLINLILGQVFTVFVITYYQFAWGNNISYIRKFSRESFSLVILVISIIISTISIILLKEIISLTNQEIDNKISKQKLQDSQDLIQVLRSHQHDFINHLQVIYSAAQLGKLDEANEYFHGIVKQVKELGAVSRIVYPEIAALIHSKIAKAEELSAKVSVNINTDLKSLHISPIDLSRVLGNLLDNAIYEIKEVVPEERELAIRIIENEEGFSFTIFNRYPIIPESLHGKIFEAGYSTKGEAGSGLGLHNVKELVAKNHGTVKVISKVGEGTTFVVSFKDN